ncbi:MAG: hypothetical protein ACOC6F_01550 [bacterium]
MAYYPCDYDKAPQDAHKAKSRLRRLLSFLGACAVVAVGVAVYVLLNRLDDQVLTVIATIGCAAGVAMPGTLLAIVLLIRRAQDSERREARTKQSQTAQPMILPLTLLQPQQLSPQGQVPATWVQAPRQRRFVIVGDEGSDQGEPWTR